MAHTHRRGDPCGDELSAPPFAPLNTSSRVDAHPVTRACVPSPPPPPPQCQRGDYHHHPSPTLPSPSPSPSSPQTRPPSDLERMVRAIQRSSAPAETKGAQIHALFVAQRELAASVHRQSAKSLGTFPGPSATRGCEHYSRNCWIRAECCQRYYPCRRCHDEAEDHEIDRRATKVVACAVCGDADQPVAANCRTCGIKFARYFCEPCRLYDDSPTTTAYHCNDCGICRKGKGLGIDNYHCKNCATCMPLETKDSHPCRERNLESNCPICGHYLATSTEQTMFLKCSHPVHVNCLEKHMKSSYVCPVCSKCIPEKSLMNTWYRKLDQRLAFDHMPERFRNRVSRVLCNDCETQTVTRFHFQFHKCNDCNGYNTRVLHQYDVNPADLPQTLVRGETAFGGGPSN